MNNSLPVYAVDFETYYDNECSVAPLGPRAYCRHGKFDPYLVTVAGPLETWAGAPENFDWHKLKGCTVVSHNAGFDKTVYLWLHSKDSETFPHPDEFAEWNCTANLTAFLCNRRSLAQAWQHLYKEALSKATRQNMKGQNWKDMTEAFQAEVIEYAIQDAVKCRLLWLHFVDKWSSTERRLSEITIQSSIKGSAVDMDLVKEFIAACEDEKQDVEETLPWMQRAANAKPTSPKEIKIQCDLDDIAPPPVKYHNEEAYEEWEAAHREEFPWVARLGDWRQINKALKTLETIRDRATEELAENGEWYWSMDAPLKYFGAHTGRWSGDSGVNFQNFRKKPIQCQGIDIDIRAVFIPRPGHTFVIADYAQIEPRCLAWLAQDEKFLQMVRDGWSVYEAHARACMGWKGKGLKQKNKSLYALAKASRLGLGYGCGHKKFRIVAKSLAGLDLTEAQCERAVESFREGNPKITGLWRKLQNAFAASRGRNKDGTSRNFDLELPSGRTMTYPMVKNERRPKKRKPGEKVDPTGNDVWEYKLTADVGGKRVPFYGGKLCENLVQATARDVFVEGLIRVVDAGYHVPFHVHDELIVEVPEGTEVETIINLLEVAPDWMPDLPTEVEADQADRYQK